MNEARQMLILRVVVIGIIVAVIGGITALIVIHDSGVKTCHESYVTDYADYGTPYDMGESAYCDNTGQ